MIHGPYLSIIPKKILLDAVRLFFLSFPKNLMIYLLLFFIWFFLFDFHRSSCSECLLWNPEHSTLQLDGFFLIMLNLSKILNSSYGSGQILIRSYRLRMRIFLFFQQVVNSHFDHCIKLLWYSPLIFYNSLYNMKR